MNRPLVAFVAFVACAAVATAAGAAGQLEVRAQLDSASVGLGETVLLTVEAASSGRRALDLDCDFALENLEVVAGPASSKSFSFLNGDVSRSESLSWRLRPLAAGRGRVRQIRARVRGEVLELPDQELAVTARSSTPPAVQPPSFDPFGALNPFTRRRPGRGYAERQQPKVFLRAAVTPEHPYLGQQVLYTLYLYTQGSITSVVPEQMPDFQGFWTIEVPVGDQTRPEWTEVRGERYGRVVLLQRALFPLRPGTFEMRPVEATVEMNLPQVDSFGSLLGLTQQLRPASNAVTIQVEPLPPPPAGFGGAVGQLRLDASLTPPRLAPGETATLTVSMAGTGHIQALPPLELPTLPGVKILAPSERSEDRLDGVTVQGSRIWTYLLVAEQPGSWRLPALEMPYFDPSTASYATASTQPLELDVAPQPAAAAEGEIHPIRNAALPTPARHDLRRPLTVLFLLPWALALALLLRRRRLPDRPARRQARLLLRRELASAATLERPAELARHLEDAWRHYLARGWQLAPDDAPPDWPQRLADRGAAPAAVAELLRLVEDIHFLRRAPELSSTEALAQDLIERSRRLARHLPPDAPGRTPAARVPVLEATP